jgi:hypothetical protein
MDQQVSSQLVKTDRLILNIAVSRFHVESVTECSSVPYTNKSVALVWLTTFGLFALAGFGMLPGLWLLPFLLVALAAPALILRNQHPVSVIARSRKRTRTVSEAGDQSPLDLGGIDIYRWENEGGAPTYRRIGEPVQAAP